MIGHLNLPVITFLILAHHSTAVPNWPKLVCVADTNFTSDEPFQTNLNTLLSALPKNMYPNGFYNGSVGFYPERANAIVLCRGDMHIDACRSCVQTAISHIVQLCPNYRQAILWEELCMLRFSNETILGNLGDTSRWGATYAVDNDTSPREFINDLGTLLQDLRYQVHNGGSSWKLAAGNRSMSILQTIYALVQCTPDLSSTDCNTCLIAAAGYLPQCCGVAVRATLIMISCTLRYDILPFYNETRILEFVTLPSPNITDTLQVPSRPGKENHNRTKTITIATVSAVVTLILGLVMGFLIRKGTFTKSNEEIEIHGEALDEISIIESLQYDFSIIRAATDDFAETNKLGKGGFGVVYKGKLRNSQEIAVKRLSRDSGQGDIEFKNEVMLLARLQHRNLVKLLGFSLEGAEKLLVYEFVQNASLDQFIFDPAKRSTLDWGMRYKIIGGIARGILYLHEDSRLRIIHRDLKVSNVLLDGEMNPKIADFGMARLFVPDETQGNTMRIVGSHGYMAPEYAMHGQFSVKSDVFSFGVLLLEIISGQRNKGYQHGEDLIRMTWENWLKGSAADMVDPILRESSHAPPDTLRCVHIGLLCVQEKASERPTMASIVMMLNSVSSNLLPVPSKPPTFLQNVYEASLEESNVDEGNSQKFSNRGRGESDHSISTSQNEMSFSDFHPR